MMLRMLALSPKPPINPISTLSPNKKKDGEGQKKAETLRPGGLWVSSAFRSSWSKASEKDPGKGPGERGEDRGGRAGGRVSFEAPIKRHELRLKTPK